jgi:hypothetical protein
MAKIVGLGVGGGGGGGGGGMKRVTYKMTDVFK